MSVKYKFDAIEVKVSGFTSRNDAARIIPGLYSLGYRLKDFGNGSLLDDGGEIVTHIMAVDDLQTDCNRSLKDIYTAVCIRPSIHIFVRKFSIVQEWTNRVGDSETA